jgi:hypothetical protein
LNISFIEGHLSYFHILSIMNKAAVNIYVHFCENIFITLTIPRTGIAESHGILRKLLDCFSNVFHSNLICLLVLYF